MTETLRLSQRGPADLVREDRVHRAVYTDPEIFEQEMDRVFESTWVYVGHESEIPQPGDFKATRLGRNPVILTRDDQGHLHLLFNRCSHRATTVCQEECGSAKYFRCAYHGWTFRLNGELIGATYPTAYDPATFDPDDYGLTRVPRVESYRGFVFGCLRPDVESLESHLGNVKPYLDLRLDAAPDGEWVVRSGAHRYSFPGNWKLQMENGVDGYHGNFVHEAVFDKIPALKEHGFGTGRSLGEAIDLGKGHAVVDSRPDLAGLASVLAVPVPGQDEYRARLLERLGPERAQAALLAGGEALNVAIFPNLLLIANQIRVVFPRAVDQTEVEMRPVALAGAPAELNTHRLRMHEMYYGPAGAVGTDDVEIFGRVSEGLKVQAAEWLMINRGLFREQERPDGARVGQFTDETPQRALYRRWLELMEAGR